MGGARGEAAQRQAQRRRVFQDIQGFSGVYISSAQRSFSTRHTMSCSASSALQMRPRQQAAESGYSEMEMNSSVYVTSTRPCAIAPTTNTTGTVVGSAGTKADRRWTAGAEWERPMRRAPTGRCAVTGCLMTRSSLDGPSEARMDSFCSSWTGGE